MTSRITDKKEIERQLSSFIDRTSTLMLATVNDDGLPEASYAPYVEHDGCYYILISGLASHTANLKKSGMASILFMDNCDNVHAFAQKRLTCHCTATAVTREGDLFASLMALMEESFGKLITTLRGLNDFQLFQLSPIKGNFVAGFGQAFEVDFPLGGDIRHKKPG